MSEVLICVANSISCTRFEGWFRCFRLGTLSLEGELVAWLSNFEGLIERCEMSARSQ
jgi:hypothetical protein